MDNTTTNVQGREIKFRAWHKEKHIMAEVGDLIWTGDVHVSYKSGLEKPGYFFGGNNVGADWKKDEHILMQFTGLRDKSGKEIYEGDVDSHGRYIEYRDGGFHVVQDNGQTYDYLCHMKHIEIVGNIYEPLPAPPTEGIIAEGLIDHGV